MPLEYPPSTLFPSQHLSHNTAGNHSTCSHLFSCRSQNSYQPHIPSPAHRHSLAANPIKSMSSSSNKNIQKQIRPFIVTPARPSTNDQEGAGPGAVSPQNAQAGQRNIVNLRAVSIPLLELVCGKVRDVMTLLQDNDSLFDSSHSLLSSRTILTISFLESVCTHSSLLATSATVLFHTTQFLAR